jgi:hypothetical protein
MVGRRCGIDVTGSPEWCSEVLMMMISGEKHDTTRRRRKQKDRV